LKAFGDPTQYYLMFGPDQCGSTNRIHVILNYKGKNHLKKDDIYFSPSDRRSHLLTLVIRPDNSYTVSVDMEEKHAGNLKDDFDFLPPKQIKDPEQSKPSDWIDDPMMMIRKTRSLRTGMRQRELLTLKPPCPRTGMRKRMANGKPR